MEKHIPLWLIPCFLGLAAYFVIFSGDTHTSDEINLVSSEFVSNNYVRDPLQEPIYTKLKMEYKCNNCHDHFTSVRTTQNGVDGPLIGDHKNLVLNHGANDRCLNCHHPKNREAFVNHDGSEIPYEKSVDLCRKCHGPKYNDWLKGVHGRPIGFWDAQKGESKKGVCIQCHDPHSPKFKPIKSAPAPKSKNGH